MGFGPGFCQWISLFYCDVESAVIINGWTSPFFRPSRGVRQGCPLSPLLYVLCAEVLACNLRSSVDISGLRLPGSSEELKCCGYADDTTVIITTEASLPAVFQTYSRYELGTGAKLNRSKSKGLWLGAWKKRTDSPEGLDWVKYLPVLGAVLSASDYTKETWEPRVAKVEKRLNSWKGRTLSYQGRALIVNMLALSQIWHLCAVLVMPAWVATRLDKAIWSFFWGGRRDLVARRTTTTIKSAGGFGIIDFRLKANALRIQWLRRFFTDSSGKWKILFWHLLWRAHNVFPDVLFRQKTIRTVTSTDLPIFYDQIIKAWRLFQGGTHDGILVVGCKRDVPLPLSEISTQKVYRLGLALRHRPPHCEGKFRQQYGDLYWKDTWNQLHMVSLDRPVIDLCWKIAHGVLYTAARLVHTFGYRRIDDKCFCGADIETLEHLFFSCSFAQILINWVYFQLIRSVPDATPFTVQELLFGFTGQRKRSIPSIIMWMLHVIKHRIWVARCDYRFRNIPMEEEKVLKHAIVRIKFLLCLYAKKHSSPRRRALFVKEWLAGGCLGVFNGEKLDFSF